MMRINFKQFRLGLALVVLSSILIGCSTQASTKYWGLTNAPDENAMHYITGSEPESLDPQIVTGQPEARLLIGLFDRLVEYHPKTLDPIPSLATHWEENPDGTVYTFYLRQNAKFSNGDPIKAEDLAWSFRRSLSPELASRYAFLAYDIKYGEAYNSGRFFVKDKDGSFLLVKDFEKPKPTIANPETTAPPADSSSSSTETPAENASPKTEFEKFITSPERVTVPEKKEDQEKLFKDNPKLKAAIEGKELVPLKGEDIGVEVVGDYVLRITLKQTAPYFVGVLTHQLFSALHRPTIEKHGDSWIKPENIVTSGSHKLSLWKPYDELVIVKDPNYWDAENVKIQSVTFYPMDEQTTMMNIYKSGRVDALYNKTVPAAWNDHIRQFKHEYLLHPEKAIEYYTFSVQKPPVDKLSVRRAFSLSIDRDALEKFRKIAKKTAEFTPVGIFPKYEEAKARVFPRLIKENNISPEEWEKRTFNPQKACDLMKEAGYTVTPGENGRCTVTNFPADDITLSYNTAESNKQVAEFVQAQWRQNLGITVPLKNMEWRTYLDYRSKIEYTGVARAGWVGDFTDPQTFLSQFYSQNNDSSTGWWNPTFDRMLDEANQTRDPMKRLEKMAEAEFFMLMDQPVIPLSTSGTNWMKKPYVKGMYPNPGTMHPWKFVYIERDPAKWDENVENIMKVSDPQVDAHIEALIKTQQDFEQSKKSAAGE